MTDRLIDTTVELSSSELSNNPSLVNNKLICSKSKRIDTQSSNDSISLSDASCSSVNKNITNLSSPSIQTNLTMEPIDLPSKTTTPSDSYCHPQNVTCPKSQLTPDILENNTSHYDVSENIKPSQNPSTNEQVIQQDTMSQEPFIPDSLNNSVMKRWADEFDDEEEDDDDVETTEETQDHVEDLIDVCHTSDLRSNRQTFQTSNFRDQSFRKGNAQLSDIWDAKKTGTRRPDPSQWVGSSDNRDSSRWSATNRNTLNNNRQRDSVLRRPMISTNEDKWQSNLGPSSKGLSSSDTGSHTRKELPRKDSGGGGGGNKERPSIALKKILTEISGAATKVPGRNTSIYGSGRPRDEIKVPAPISNMSTSEIDEQVSLHSPRPCKGADLWETLSRGGIDEPLVPSVSEEESFKALSPCSLSSPSSPIPRKQSTIVSNEESSFVEFTHPSINDIAKSVSLNPSGASKRKVDPFGGAKPQNIFEVIDRKVRVVYKREKEEERRQTCQDVPNTAFLEGNHNFETKLSPSIQPTSQTNSYTECDSIHNDHDIPINKHQQDLIQPLTTHDDATYDHCYTTNSPESSTIIYHGTKDMNDAIYNDQSSSSQTFTTTTQHNMTSCSIEQQQQQQQQQHMITGTMYNTLPQSPLIPNSLPTVTYISDPLHKQHVVDYDGMSKLIPSKTLTGTIQSSHSSSLKGIITQSSPMIQPATHCQTECYSQSIMGRSTHVTTDAANQLINEGQPPPPIPISYVSTTGEHASNFNRIIRGDLGDITSFSNHIPHMNQTSYLTSNSITTSSSLQNPVYVIGSGDSIIPHTQPMSQYNTTLDERTKQPIYHVSFQNSYSYTSQNPSSYSRQTTIPYCSPTIVPQQPSVIPVPYDMTHLSGSVQSTPGTTQYYHHHHHHPSYTYPTASSQHITIAPPPPDRHSSELRGHSSSHGSVDSHSEWNHPIRRPPPPPDTHVIIQQSRQTHISGIPSNYSDNQTIPSPSISSSSLPIVCDLSQLQLQQPLTTCQIVDHPRSSGQSISPLITYSSCPLSSITESDTIRHPITLIQGTTSQEYFIGSDSRYRGTVDTSVSFEKNKQQYHKDSDCSMSTISQRVPNNYGRNSLSLEQPSCSSTYHNVSHMDNSTSSDINRQTKQITERHPDKVSSQQSIHDDKTSRHRRVRVANRPMENICYDSVTEDNLIQSQHHTPIISVDILERDHDRGQTSLNDAQCRLKDKHPSPRHGVKHGFEKSNDIQHRIKNGSGTFPTQYNKQQRQKQQSTVVLQGVNTSQLRHRKQQSGNHNLPSSSSRFEHRGTYNKSNEHQVSLQNDFKLCEESTPIHTDMINQTDEGHINHEIKDGLHLQHQQGKNTESTIYRQQHQGPQFVIQSKRGTLTHNHRHTTRSSKFSNDKEYHDHIPLSEELDTSISTIIQPVSIQSIEGNQEQPSHSTRKYPSSNQRIHDKYVESEQLQTGNRFYNHDHSRGKGIQHHSRKPWGTTTQGQHKSGISSTGSFQQNKTTQRQSSNSSELYHTQPDYHTHSNRKSGGLSQQRKNIDDSLTNSAVRQYRAVKADGQTQLFDQQGNTRKGSLTHCSTQRYKDIIQSTITGKHTDSTTDNKSSLTTQNSLTHSNSYGLQRSSIQPSSTPQNSSAVTGRTISSNHSGSSQAHQTNLPTNKISGTLLNKRKGGNGIVGSGNTKEFQLSNQNINQQTSGILRSDSITAKSASTHFNTDHPGQSNKNPTGTAGVKIKNRFQLLDSDGGGAGDDDEDDDE